MKKIRYVKQKDYTSCGPVALINIMKWLGWNVTYGGYIESARALCNHEPGREGGTDIWDMERALKKLGIKKKRKKNPTLEDIDKHIDSGGAILIEYVAPYRNKILNKGEGHFSLCIGRSDKTYTLVNDGSRRAVGKRTRTMMKIMLYGGKENRYVWLISK